MIGKSDSFVQHPMCAAQSPEESYPLPAAEPDHQLLRKPPSTVQLPSSRNSVQTNTVSNTSGDRDTSRQARRDPEKGSVDHSQRHSHRRSSLHASVVYTEDEDSNCGDENDGPKKHAVWILVGHRALYTHAHQLKPSVQFYLSALAPLIALSIALYTLLATMLLFILTPLLLLSKQRPLSTRFSQFLAPPIRFQLRLSVFPWASDPPNGQSAGSIGLLVLVNFLAPVYAMVIMVAAWVGGIFWFYTAILGNPDGKEERDDGRDAVLVVKAWWERWLIQGLR